MDEEGRGRRAVLTDSGEKTRLIRWDAVSSMASQSRGGTGGNRDTVRGSKMKAPECLISGKESGICPAKHWCLLEREGGFVTSLGISPSTESSNITLVRDKGSSCGKRDPDKFLTFAHCLDRGSPYTPSVGKGASASVATKHGPNSGSRSAFEREALSRLSLQPSKVAICPSDVQSDPNTHGCSRAGAFPLVPHRPEGGTGRAKERVCQVPDRPKGLVNSSMALHSWHHSYDRPASQHRRSSSGRLTAVCLLWLSLWSSLMAGGSSVLPGNRTLLLRKFQEKHARCLHSERCVDPCLPTDYKHSENGCLTREECLALKHVLHNTPTGNRCLSTCPKYYEKDEEDTCKKTDICGSQRIINSVSKLNDLRGCKVIDGNLQIVLIEDARKADWENQSFPELQEITEFLLVYRVKGLRSLGQLFPNLRVIRGSVRHQGYALVIYDLEDLEAVGLYSLTRILTGGVRIQNNFNLCYVHTVDWSLITSPTAENVFKNNYNNLCSPCKDNCTGRNNVKRCWDSTHCQRVCDREKCGDRDCTEDGECCHEYCAGGCKHPGKAEYCYACKNYSQRHTCVETCGTNRYKYNGYRCILKSECINQMQGIVVRKSGLEMDECIDQKECPDKYVMEEVDDLGAKHLECKECKDPGESCAKVCSEILVNTIPKAQQLMGCTKIQGRLIISITGGKAITKELNESLGKIEVVTDYVLVFNSNALRSLDFLKSLRLIEGSSLYNDKYALYVHGNDNLEEIWSWKDHSNFTIKEKKASILFHSNPKLCYKKIKELLQRTHKEEMTADCNMNLTNGNKAACMDNTLTLKLKPLALRGTVMVTWNNDFINDDDRMLMGYYIFYKVASEDNVTYLDGRDACHDDWSRKYVENKNSVDYITQNIEGLEPATRYAVYVQTDTIVDAAIGGISNISYVTTLSFNPGRPLNVMVTDKTYKSLTVKWSPPRSPNGVIEQYIVTVTHLPYLEDTSEATCTYGDNLLKSHLSSLEEQAQTAAPPLSSVSPSITHFFGGGKSECCACPETRKQERLEEIDFEDELYGLVYMRRNTRQKRSIVGEFVEDHLVQNLVTRSLNRSQSNPAVYQNPDDIMNSSSVVKPHDCEYMEGFDISCKDSTSCQPHTEESCWSDLNKLLNGGGSIVKNTSGDSVTISGLHHFTRYEIKVVACHSPNTTHCPSNMTKCVLCTLNPEVITATTDAKAGANLVAGLREINTSKDGMKSFTWTRPSEPNGKVVAYKVKILPIETIGHIKTPCITEKKFQEDNMTFHLNMSQLLPGRYNLSVETYTRPDSPTNKSLEAVVFVVEGGPDTPLPLKLLAVVLLVVVVLIVVMVLVLRVCRETEEKIVTINPIYAQDTGPPAWIQHVYDTIGSQGILDSSDLHVEDGPQLGEGKFGRVLNGQLRLESNIIPVAVKVTDSQAREDILQEAKLMLKLNCYHLVRAYGVVPKASHVLLVMEYMNQGDLLKYIRASKLKAQDDDILSVITVDHVCAMAVQIADGMAYLASHKIVHRDLAARNCLINDNMNIKISDFGMARLTDNDYYKIQESKYFPVRWLPPEYHWKFTSQSDVWSYGIVLWEILSGGARPYEHLKYDNDVLQQVRRGYTLESHIPKGTPSFLAKIMISCWRYKGCMRPYFPQLVAALLPSTSPWFIQHFRMVSFYHTADGQEYKRQLDTQQEVDDDSDITTPLNESSPSPFGCPLRQEAPPLPPRPLAGLRWRPSFPFCGATVPRYTRQPTHLPSTDVENLTMSRQIFPGDEEEFVTDAPASQEFPSRTSLVDPSSRQTQDEAARIILETSTLQDQERESAVSDSLPNLLGPGTATPSNIVVQLNSRGDPSSSILPPSGQPNSPEKIEITLPTFKCSKKLPHVRPSPC